VAYLAIMFLVLKRDSTDKTREGVYNCNSPVYHEKHKNHQHWEKKSVKSRKLEKVGGKHTCVLCRVMTSLTVQSTMGEH
jgi:hypothetical protein